MTEAVCDATIEEIEIPESVEADNAADFIAAVRVRNIVETDGYGTDELTFTPAEILPGWRDTVHMQSVLFGARYDNEIVARAWLERPRSDETGTGWVGVQVLPEHRGHGIGTALADRVEDHARELGLSKLIVYTVSKDAPGDRLYAPTGFGSVPLDNPEVQLLTSRGYTLEQVERGSRLALPVDVSEQLALATDHAGEDYRLHYWVDRTPERWLDDVAVLNTRMSTDAPSAGLEEPEIPWTADRIRDEEERESASPRVRLTAAVEHVPSGSLVGFTELSAPAEKHRPVSQEDTLVLSEHRGRALGMLLKLANLEHVQRERPGHPAVITFNAEENRHMLAVNEAVGFVPIGFEGAWKKIL